MNCGEQASHVPGGENLEVEGLRAIHALARMGYRIRLEGGVIRVRYRGAEKPDPSYVSTLVAQIKRHKDQVLFFLRCLCPRCGGVVFAPDHKGQSVCFSCDWTRGPMPAKQSVVDSLPACGGCTLFRPSHLNPAQGFGRCGNVDMSGRLGAYPGKSACHHHAPISTPQSRDMEKAMNESGPVDRQGLNSHGLSAEEEVKLAK